MDYSNLLSGVFGALATIIPVCGVWLIKVLQERAAILRTARGDAITEWQQIVERQQTELVAQSTKHQTELVALNASQAKLEQRLYDVLQREQDCEKQHALAREHVARQEATIQALTYDVRRLQLLAHDSPPPVTVPCILTASASDGIVRAASPASGPILGWLPEELVGQSIEVIIPPEGIERHRAGMRRVLAGGKVDASKTIRTMAIKRTGERVAVQINLFAWSTPLGSVMINADIRMDVPPIKELAPATEAAMAILAGQGEETNPKGEGG